MSFYRVFPDPRLAISPDTAEGVEQLASLYHPVANELVRVNMIAHPSGETVGADGTSGSLSTAHDRLLVRIIRSFADAVIIGAETLRRERIPHPAGAALVVLSASGDIRPGNVIPSDSPGELVIVSGAPDRVSQSLGDTPYRLLATGPGLVPPADIIALCRAEGWNHLLIEGGRNTVTPFVEAGAVDELCLTLTGAPRIQTTPPLPWWPTVDTWDTRHLLTDDQRMLFYRLTTSSSEAS